MLTTPSRLEELVVAPTGPVAWTQSTLAYDLVVHPIEGGGLGTAVTVPVAGRWIGRGVQLDDDGRLVGSTWVPGQGTGTAQIERLDHDGRRHELAQVAATAGQQVLADGRVVFWDVSATAEGYMSGESPFGGMHLVAVDAQGVGSTWIPLSDRDYEDWALDPAGTTLAVQTPQQEVWIVPVDTDPSQAQDRIPGVRALFGFSTDGTLALATAEGLSVWEKGALRTVLAADQGEVVQAAWLDDRRLLAHTQDRVIRVDVPSGGYRTWMSVQTVPRQRRDVAVSPNGRWVLIDHSRVHGDVWVADIVEE